MTKYAKLAIAPDGTIVTRNTGAKVRAKGLQVVDNRVYKEGRLYGYLSTNLTASQKEKIAKVSAGREKRQVKQAYTQMLKMRGLPQIGQDFTVDSAVGAGLMQIYNKVGRGWLDVSKMDQSVLNYANVLKAGIKEGKLTKEQADALYKRYMQAENNQERRRIWNSTSELFDKEGFKYNIEKSRVQGEDDLVDITKETGVDVIQYWREKEENAKRPTLQPKFGKFKG